MYSNGVGPQVLSTLVTALPLQDNTKYQHCNTKIFRKHRNLSFGRERERDRERSALFAWSVFAREGRCGCLVSWIRSEKEQKYGYWLSILNLEYLVI